MSHLSSAAVHHVSANFDWLWAALIGVGGATIGGVASGWVVVIAGRRQWQRDREDAQRDRSQQAAEAIADALAAMDAAVVVWQANQHDTESLRLAYGDCARGVRIQMMTMKDQVLRDRLNRHMQATSIFVSNAIKGARAAQAMSETIRRHTQAMISALEACVSGQPLPAYKALDPKDPSALANWGGGKSNAQAGN